jgi:hypothetical protein
MSKQIFAAQARSELARTFTAANIAAEVTYLQAAGRASFERPYGLAWLLQLVAELREWDDPQAKEMAANLHPLARIFRGAAHLHRGLLD